MWQLHQGDCVEVMREMESNSVDAVVTDPPYGIDLQPQRGITKSIVGDGAQEARELWAGFVPEAHRILKNNTASLFFTGWSEMEWAKPLLAKYFTVKSCIVWVKNVWGIGYYTRPQHEMALYCHKGNPPLPEEPQSDVWFCDRVHKPKHSCEKPVSLAVRAVKLCTEPDAVILDPFAGSGAILEGAVQVGRRAVGIEIDGEYCQQARRRLSAIQVNLFR